MNTVVKMKTLRELFKQYTPSDEICAFFDSVKEYQVRKSKRRADFFEIDLNLDKTISKSLLYEAEEEIRRAYDGKYLPEVGLVVCGCACDGGISTDGLFVFVL